MTPTELAIEVEELRSRFLQTANQKFGLSNYQAVMREYQRQMLDLLTILRQAAILIGQASNRPECKCEAKDSS